LSREELLGRGVVETMPGIKDTLFPNYVRCLETGEPLALDDFSYDNEILRDTRRYDLRVTRATPTSLVLTWRDVTDRFNAAEVISRADERFRRSMDNATIGMCLIAPDGGFLKVNNALCELFGYDAETLMSMTWQELTAPEFLDAELHNVNDVLEGRLESYRMLKQYIHADGHRIWGGLSVSCDRDDNGRVENFISQITDVTEQVLAAVGQRPELGKTEEAAVALDRVDGAKHAGQPLRVGRIGLQREEVLVELIEVFARLDQELGDELAVVGHRSRGEKRTSRSGSRSSDSAGQERRAGWRNSAGSPIRSSIHPDSVLFRAQRPHNRHQHRVRSRQPSDRRRSVHTGGPAG
jgi:PAS domain S-box-containing protein